MSLQEAGWHGHSVTTVDASVHGGDEWTGEAGRARRGTTLAKTTIRGLFGTMGCACQAKNGRWGPGWDGGLCPAWSGPIRLVTLCFFKKIRLFFHRLGL